MARDRKRRQRREDAPGDAELAREVGFSDDTVDRAGLGEGTAAPDPLKKATPDVDQAKLSEAGAGRGASGEIPVEEDGVEYVPAPDEVEGDQPVRRGDLDPSVAEESERPAKQRGRVFTFLRHCVDELRRVQWPDRKQVGQATAVVLGFVVLAGGYLGLADALFKPLVQAIL